LCNRAVDQIHRRRFADDAKLLLPDAHAQIGQRVIPDVQKQIRSGRSDIQQEQ
jgi:hypothetical protein